MSGINLSGAVELSHEGQPYRMTINMTALCTYEEVTGKNGFAVLSLLARGGVAAGLVGARDLRALIYGGLRGHHADVTLDLAGEILDSNAGMIQTALAAASPQPGDDPEEENAPGKPTRRKRRRAK